MDASMVSTASDTEDWTMLDSTHSATTTSQNDPKIGGDSNKIDDGGEEDKNECQDFVKNENPLNTKTRRRCNSNRSDDDTEGGRDTDEDSICVISESEDNHERIEEVHLECHEKLSELLKQKIEPELIPDLPPFEDVKENTQIAVTSSQQSSLALKQIKEALHKNRTISYILVALIAAGIAGLVSHASLMVHNHSVRTEDVTKYLMYERKIADLETENYDLKLKLQLLEEKLILIEPIIQSEDKLDTPEQYPPSGSGKNKRVRTRYDRFKRPPVAAGGDEETIHNIHVSPLEDLEWESELVQQPLNLPPEGSTGIEIETIDFTNFEPITNEVENRTFETLNLPKAEPDSKKKEEHESKKYVKKEKNQKKEKKYCNGGDSNNTETCQRKGNGNEKEKERKPKLFDNNSKESYRKKHYDSNESKQENDDDSHEYDRERRSHTKERRHERHFKERNHSGEGQNDNQNKQRKYDKTYDKREDGSGNKNWQEKRMKFREDARKKDENWYLERQFDREMSRNSREKDNWYIERKIDRELLRGMPEGSAERIK